MSLATIFFNTVCDYKKIFLLCVLPLAIANYAHATPDGGSLSQDSLTLPILEKKEDQELPLTAASIKIEQEQEGAVKVLVNSIVFKGSTVFSLKTLEAQVSAELGKEHSFVGMERLSARILRLYQKAGYLMAQVYFPEQNLKTGVLKININEGLLDKINIEKNGRLKRLVTEKYTAILENDVLNSASLERVIRLLSDLPDNEVRLIFEPSIKEGHANLSVITSDVKDNKGYISIDNHANRYVGGTRVSGQFNLNNKLGYGETFIFNAASSEKNYHYVAFGTAFPIGGNGLLLNSSLSTTKYALGETFSALDADGDNQEISFGLHYPIIRSLNKNLNIGAKLKHQQFDDRVGVSNFSAEKQVTSLSLIMAGDFTSKVGHVTQWNVNVNTGSINLDSSAKNNDSYSTDGHFVKLNSDLTYRHRLGDKWTVEVKAQAQLAGSNLDSSVKMQLGGSNAVRAYPQGEASVDTGLLTNIEFSYRKSADVEFAGFFDVAVGKEHKNKLSTDTDNIKHLSGFGAKVAWRLSDKLKLSSSVAWRTGAKPASDTRDIKPRYWLQLTHYF